VKGLKALSGPSDSTPLTVKAHAGCPGRTAYLHRNIRTVEPVYVCTDWRKQGHRDRHSSRPAQPLPTDEKAQDKARQERRSVIDNNKAWASAETVRRDWLRTFLTRKNPPKGAAAAAPG
jgi:ParB family chromosome partitioning protein